MKRRLLIAKAMVHRPPILVFDETTAGVDVELRQNLSRNVTDLNEQGVTKILTTHLIVEAEAMFNRIGSLNKGNMVKVDTTENLLDRIKTKKIICKVAPSMMRRNDGPSRGGTMMRRNGGLSRRSDDEEEERRPLRG